MVQKKKKCKSMIKLMTHDSLEFARPRDLEDLQNLQSPQKNAHDCTEVCDRTGLSKDILGWTLG
jgi:hypothetical protein